MKIKKFLYWLFVLFILVVIAYGIHMFFDNVTVATNVFTTDGYAVYLKGNNLKTSVETFTGGTEYNYKKYDNKVSFVSNSNDNVTLDNNTGIHYQNNNILLLKNVVGIDLTKIEDELILYYNLFQDTEINYDTEEKEYYVENVAKEKIEFKKLLLRFDENKFLVAGEDIRVSLANKQVVDFGNYLYFEYTNGSVVKLYNRDKFYQTIPTDASIVIGNNTIDLAKKYISINNKNIITLSNLAIDMDGNIDVVTERNVNKLKIEKSNVSKDILSGSGTEQTELSSGGSSGGGGSQQVEIANDLETSKEPTFKVISFDVTAMRIDATVEITDTDELLVDPIEFSIVENATGKVVYNKSQNNGNYYVYLSYSDLNPDTEYTLYGKASYKVDDMTFEKTFLSKIFRTEALGVAFEKSYVTTNSIVLNVTRENYSNVSSATIGIYDESGTIVDYETIDFTSGDADKSVITFNELEHNETYVIKMYDVICSGVRVDDRFLQSENIKTLKKAPTIENLSYRISKISSSFELEIGKVTDEDYGIYNYRYEIFDARQNLSTEKPIKTIEKKDTTLVDLVVDDVSIHRGVAYTYRIVAEFYDNEKTIEYITDLGTVMQLDGVPYPTLRWDETKVTWEQINGVIAIEDSRNVIVSDTYKVVYKNSIDLYEEDIITTETSAKEIPISINHLRANETYTFDVYAKVNLQDGNLPADQTYIGSVKVQTSLPNKLQGNFVRGNAYSDIFSIDFSLSDYTEDASFEASTLTSLNFTIYQGTTTSGKVEVFKKTIDSFDNEYVSSLKRDFYDATATLNPDFFDSDNSDFRQQTYTLVVDSAYDYTGYDSNIIPIENNVFQFQVNHYVPGLPESGLGQATTKIIYNRNATSFGLTHDDNLSLNTPVGVSVTGTFDNVAKSARFINYFVYRKNQFTGEFEHLTNLDKTVYYDANGDVESPIYPIGSGTSSDVLDSDMLRRGNTYYIAYEVHLDIDNDETVDTIYPNDIDSDFVLRSYDIIPLKQEPLINLYPSTSDNTSFSWKYKYTDIDKALSEEKLFGYTSSSDISVSSSSILEDNDYNMVTFDHLVKGETFSIKMHEILNKSGDSSDKLLTSQYFYGKQDDLPLTYTVSTNNNNLTLTIDDYNENYDYIRLISFVDVIISPTNPSDLERLGAKTLSNYPIKNGKVTIDYYPLIDYFNLELEIQLIAHFDNGVTGFDSLEPHYALQSATYAEIGNYYSILGSRLIPAGSIYGNYFTGGFNPNNGIISVISNQNEYEVEITIDETGVLYNNNNIIAKNIALSELSTEDNVFNFDKVVPGITLVGDNNKLSIVPLLDAAYINATIYTYDVINIQDNLIHCEIYQTNDSGTNSVFEREVTFSVSDFSESLYIDNLERIANYYLRFYAYIYDSQTNQYVKNYLYDVDQKLIGCRYNFSTLSNVGFSDLEASFVATSYNAKKISVTYNLGNVTGYDYIKYKLYVWDGNDYVPSGITIRDSTVFYRSMHIDIDGSPKANNPIVYGGRYKIEMTAYGVIDVEGEESVLELGTASKEFEIGPYSTPYIGISSGKTENSIYYRITVNDLSYVVYNGVYSITLTDADNNVITTKNNISISDINKRISFIGEEYGLIDGMTYTLTVSLYNDFSNTGGNFSLMSKSKEAVYGSDIYLGTTMIRQSEDNSDNFQLIFSDPYRINLIDRVSYSVSSVTTGYYYSSSSDFYVDYNPTLNIYTYTLSLPENSINKNDVYLFTINFYRRNALVKQIELNYYVGVANETD